MITVVFGVLGYFFHKYNWPIIPFILCLVLGPKMEISFIQSLEMSSGSLFIFFERPLSFIVLVIASIIFAILIIFDETDEKTGD